MTVIEIVERERVRLRRAMAAMLVAVAVGATAALLLAGAWALGNARWIALPRALPAMVWVALVAANAALVWYFARRVRRHLGRESVAAAIEREQSLRAGALRGAIEIAGQGAVAQFAGTRLAAHLEARGPRLAPGSLRANRRRASQAIGVAVITVGLLLWAAPSLGDGLLAIRRPIAAWRGTLLPAIRFDGLPPALLRGEAIRIVVYAPGRRAVRLRTRTPGEGWHAADVAITGDRGSTTIRAVHGDLILVASDGRSATDTIVVPVTDRPFVGGVVLRAIYPTYLERPTEGLPVGEPARVPQGTVVEISGRASVALTSVTIHSDRDSVGLPTDGHGFRGRFTPRHSGRWDWRAQAGGGALADLPLPVEIEVVPDSVPHVELIAPAGDTVVAANDNVTLQVSASDDHGLSAIELHTVREDDNGRRDPAIAQRIANGAGTLWQATPRLTLADRDLQPGGALRVRVVAIDNSPWRQRGESRELVLRIPTMEERRSLARDAADSTASAAQRTAAAQRSLERRTEEASRERGNRSQSGSDAPGAESSPPNERRDLSYESAERARALAQEQRALTEQVNQLREAASQLEEQLRQAAALDTGLARQLREAQELLRDALTPALLEQMQKLENASRELSNESARDALRNLAEMQRRLREQLEKSAEMLKRAALEGAMETLKDEALEIAGQQRAIADSASPANAANRPNTAPPERQESSQLAERAGRLSDDIKELRERLARERAQAAAERTARAQQHASASEQSMRDQNAERAAESMEQAADEMEAAREQQVGEWKAELTDALDQSIQEMLQMAREEAALEQRARGSNRDPARNEEMRSQQSALKQGVDQTSQRLQQEGQKSSLLSGRSQRAVAEASERVEQALQQLTQPRPGQQTANALGEASEALNRAAAALARDRERVNSSASATGFAEMVEQMQEMAKRQGAINAQAQGLMPMPGQGSLSPDAQATARALARQQRGIANQLEEIGDAAGGDRAAELAREARQLAEALEQTRVDAATVARQQQLFRRLLDAGRSLEKEEREDNERREARAATGDNRFDPGAAATRGRDAARFREPEWNELRGLSAEERRAILEYFKRINAEKP